MRRPLWSGEVVWRGTCDSSPGDSIWGPSDAKRSSGCGRIFCPGAGWGVSPRAARVSGLAGELFAVDGDGVFLRACAWLRRWKRRGRRAAGAWRCGAARSACCRRSGGACRPSVESEMVTSGSVFGDALLLELRGPAFGGGSASAAEWKSAVMAVGEVLSWPAWDAARRRRRRRCMASICDCGRSVRKVQ